MPTEPIDVLVKALTEIMSKLEDLDHRLESVEATVNEIAAEVLGEDRPEP